MKVNYKGEKVVEKVEHGDLVSINGKFYIVFLEDKSNYRLNALDGIGYYGTYRTIEGLIKLLEDKINTHNDIEVFSKHKYEINLSKISF